jgi:hypothetical protein
MSASELPDIRHNSDIVVMARDYCVCPDVLPDIGGLEEPARLRYHWHLEILRTKSATQNNCCRRWETFVDGIRRRASIQVSDHVSDVLFLFSMV